MTIVGFNFTKILAERHTPVKGKINIQNKVTITDVGKSDLSLGKGKQDGVKFTFNYVSGYEPKVGEINLQGDLLFLTDAKGAKTISDSWKNDKKIPQNVMGQVLNTILQKCNVQALIASRDVNLPPMVPLPKVQVKQ